MNICPRRNIYFFNSHINVLNGVKKQNIQEYDYDSKSLNTANSYYSRQRILFGKNKFNIQQKHNSNHYRGCLLGGAIADALGAPIEFYKMSKIKKLYGDKGITKLDKYKKTGKISFTDDTQLTMFTADGLIKSYLKDSSNKEPDEKIMFNSYRNWFKVCIQKQKINDGWISRISDIRRNGSSGKSCIETLSKDNMGSLETPINNSKGSGAVMRSAPFGLMFYKAPETAFNNSVKSACLTHGNPNAYLAAGTYSAIIANIINGKKINEAIDNSIEILKKNKESEDLVSMLKKAIELSKNNDIEPMEAIKIIGKGWDGDEALAIAIYCVLKTPDDYKQTIINAVNHSGDSDTTGGIAGGISGAYLGYDSIPFEYKQKVLSESNIIKLADDIYFATLEDTKKRRKLRNKYKK